MGRGARGASISGNDVATFDIRARRFRLPARRTMMADDAGRRARSAARMRAISVPLLLLGVVHCGGRAREDASTGTGAGTAGAGGVVASGGTATAGAAGQPGHATNGG